MTIMHSIIYIGEMLRNAVMASAASMIAHCHHTELFVMDILTIGAAISATTTGRMPLKIRMTTGLSLNPVNAMAMARIIRNEGRMLPRVATMLPFVPLSL